MKRLVVSSYAYCQKTITSCGTVGITGRKDFLFGSRRQLMASWRIDVGETTSPQLCYLYSTHTYLLVLRRHGSELVLCHLDDEICNDRGEQSLFCCREDSQSIFPECWPDALWLLKHTAEFMSSCRYTWIWKMDAYCQVNVWEVFCLGVDSRI